MRYLLFVVLFMNCTFCFAQTGKFQFYITKPCETIEQLDTMYSLNPVDGSSNITYFPKSGVAHLPPGKYKLYPSLILLDDLSVIEIKDTSLVVMHYKAPKINLGIPGVDQPAPYLMCDTLANGYAEDFYPNGNLKIRGNFKRGNPKDSLVTFYDNGKVKRRETKSAKFVDVAEYDPMGRLVEIRHAERKSFIVYGEYAWTAYYPNGKIKTTESSIKHILRIKEFYPDGALKLQQDKNTKTEYYENGKRKVVYEWHIKKDSDLDNVYRIKKNEYGLNGQLLQTIVFEDWSMNPTPFFPPKLDIEESDWIVSATKYKDGKVLFTVKDFDAKEYSEKFLNR